MINPILEKELKTKMRGWRAPIMITVYLIFISTVFFFYYIESVLGRSRILTPNTVTDLYKAMIFLQLGLIVIITPALTSSAISGERERQTLDLLLCTSLSTFSIVFGKVANAVIYVVFLMASSLGILSIVLLFGGISISEFILTFIMYIVIALFFSCMGIFYSSLFKKRITAIIFSYLTTAYCAIGTIIFATLYQIITMDYKIRYMPQASFTVLENNLLYMSNPFYGMTEILTGNISVLAIFNGGYASIGSAFYTKPWFVNLIFYLTLSIIFFVVAAIKLKPVRRSK